MARTKQRGATRAETTRANGTPSPRDVIGRRREEYGGTNWGAAFFGWLVAIGVAALLTATGGLIALVAIVLATLLAAIAGGKQGTHYHRKIDRTGGIGR